MGEHLKHLFLKLIQIMWNENFFLKISTCFNKMKKKFEKRMKREKNEKPFASWIFFDMDNNSFFLFIAASINFVKLSSISFSILAWTWYNFIVSYMNGRKEYKKENVRNSNHSKLWIAFIQIMNGEKMNKFKICKFESQFLCFFNHHILSHSVDITFSILK